MSNQKDGIHNFETGAVRGTDVDDTRYDLISPIAMRRMAETYAEGAKKYSPGNYLKGIPCSNCLNHAMKHIEQWRNGDRSEDHLAHAAWNLFTIMHFEETKEEMLDKELIYFPAPGIVEDCVEEAGYMKYKKATNRQANAVEEIGPTLREAKDPHTQQLNRIAEELALKRQANAVEEVGPTPSSVDSMNSQLREAVQKRQQEAYAKRELANTAEKKAACPTCLGSGRIQVSPFHTVDNGEAWADAVYRGCPECFGNGVLTIKERSTCLSPNTNISQDSQKVQSVQTPSSESKTIGHKSFLYSLILQPLATELKS